MKKLCATLLLGAFVVAGSLGSIGCGDAPKEKPKTDAKKPSAENRTDEQPQTGRSALTLQDRSTWNLTGISRPLFGQISQNAAPLPERLSPSTGDWAVFSADEAQVARR